MFNTEELETALLNLLDKEQAKEFESQRVKFLDAIYYEPDQTELDVFKFDFDVDEEDLYETSEENYTRSLLITFLDFLGIAGDDEFLLGATEKIYEALTAQSSPDDEVLTVEEIENILRKAITEIQEN